MTSSRVMRALGKARRLAVSLLRPLYVRLGKTRRVVLGDRNRRFRVPGWRTADIVDADYLINLRV